jgi:hypothetical protein
MRQGQPHASVEGVRYRGSSDTTTAKETSANQKQDKVIINNHRYQVYTTFQQFGFHRFARRTREGIGLQAVALILEAGLMVQAFGLFFTTSP